MTDPMNSPRNPDRPDWNHLARLWLLPLAACLLFLYILVDTIPYSTGYGWSKISLVSMAWTLWSLPDWEHGLFVPFICLFIIYTRREEILRTPVQGSLRSGGAVILFGVLLYCLGLKAETQYIGFAAVEILLAGLILWFWGWKIFGLVSFAWIFFIFTFPMPFLDGMIALPLRLIMSHTAFVLLNIFGPACIQSGTAILSAPDPTQGLKTGQIFQIDIADPCSGLHSLFALMMISAIAGYMAVKSLPWRWLIFLSSIPLAIAGNVVRILMLVWGTEHFGASFALGTDTDPSAYHLGCGYVVYLVALLLLLGLIALINSPRWAATKISLPHLAPAPDSSSSTW
jgi:exosortase